MKRKFKIPIENEKMVYLSPNIEMNILASEDGLAAGSARINPGDNNGQIKHEWETGNERETDISW